jgi:hypothetical protein
VAVPVVASSPGEDQLRVTDVWARLDADRLVIWEGGVVSEGA